MASLDATFRDPVVGPIKEKVRRQVMARRRRLRDFFLVRVPPQARCRFG